MKIANLFLILLNLYFAFGSISSGPFELDGNAVASINQDWDVLYNGGGTAEVFSGVVADPEPLSIFTSGGSKDVNDISQWKHTDGSVPDKDNILNAVAAAYNVGSDTYLYFGADRYANNGDSTIGFWFFKSQMSLNNDGTFSGVHSDGDLLIISNYGSSEEIQVYMWEDDDVVLLLDDQDAKCDPNLDQSVCAITNEQSEFAPWPYTPKFGMAGEFPEDSFLEGGIILNDFYDDQIPCFSTMLAVTRSSSSLDAQLKDFVLNSVQFCDVAISLDCSDAEITQDKTLIKYTVEIGVENTGLSDLHNLKVFYNNTLIDTIVLLQPGEKRHYTKFFYTVEQTPDPNMASVIGYTIPDSDCEEFEVRAYSDPAVCPFVPLPTSIEVVVDCPNLEIDQVEEVFRYSYSGLVENTGFGDVVITDVELLGLDFVSLDQYVGTVLEPVMPNNTLDIMGDYETIEPLDTFTLNVEATDFLDNGLFDTNISDLCPPIEVNPSINVTKICEAYLEVLNNQLVVKIDTTGIVCNDGDIKLKNITVTDDLGTIDTSDDIITNIDFLEAQTCTQFEYSRYPNDISDSLEFTDSLLAVGAAILNLGIVDAVDTVTYGLCP